MPGGRDAGRADFPANSNCCGRTQIVGDRFDLAQSIAAARGEYEIVCLKCRRCKPSWVVHIFYVIFLITLDTGLDETLLST